MGRLLATIAAVCSIQFLLLLGALRMPVPLPNELRTKTNKLEKLADGCYHVFLDVGSNIGNHVRFLYEPSLYPKATIARNFFNKMFGPELGRVNSDICVFSFEPNPDHLSRHQHLKEAYRSLGWRYSPIHAGVGHYDGNITFYHTGDDLGFTTKKSNCRKECRPEHVPIIRLADWVKNEVADRILPQIHTTNALNSSHTTIPPRVAMKMDVEFMEYEVLPDLMLSGILCNNIDAVMGEFHHLLQSIAYLWPINYEKNTLGSASSSPEISDNGVWTLDRAKANEISTEWLRMMEHNPYCNTWFFMKDDESYRNDGQPLPTILA